MQLGSKRIGIASFVAALSGAVPCLAQIECGDTVGPGGKFVLEADADCPGTALTVVGPVKVDLGGHRLRCLSASAGIVVQGRSAKLENGEVDDCATGLAVGGEGGHKIDSLVVRDASLLGVDITSPNNRLTGLSVLDSDRGVTVTADGQRFSDCLVFSPSVSDGFSIQSDGNRIENCTSAETLNSGFRIEGNDNRLDDLRAIDNNSSSIFIIGDRNRVDSVVAIGGFGSGLSVLGDDNEIEEFSAVSKQSGAGISVSGNGNRVRASEAHGNPLNGLRVIGNSNEIDRNRLFGNGATGLYVEGGGNRIRGNQALGNDDPDAFDSMPGCFANRWEKNEFGSVSDPCIE